MSNNESARDEVIQKLRDCNDRKLIRGDLALKHAREVHQLASETLSTWKKVAAYRLAHVLMRSSRGTVEDLQEIDVLFSEACESRDCPALATMARVYRLAVLHRLRAVSYPTCEGQPPSDDIRVAHQQAVDAIRRSRGLESLVSRREPGAESQDVRAIIQTEAFNMLELATYFLGLPYDPLEGLGTRDVGAAAGENSWSVVARGVNPIRMTRELAVSEIRDRIRDAPRAVWFEFPKLAGRRGPEMYLRKQDSSEKVSAGELAFLTYVLASHEPSHEALCRTVSRCRNKNDRRLLGDSATYVRKQKERLTESLAKLLDRPKDSIWEGPAKGFPRLADDIRVFGAVENIHRFLS